VIRLDTFLPYRFIVLGHKLSLTNADLRAQGHRLTLQEWKVLSLVADCGPTTPFEIRRLGTQDKSTISWAIKRLKARGFVATKPRAQDGRTFDVALSAEGWRYYRALVPVARGRARQGLCVLSAAEQRTLERLVGKLLSG
jgi:MarR family transcriptional regulator, lower aerobic nicotinate degradation pathway regulator